MTKLLLILIIGLVFESTGVVLLKKGMSQVGEIKGFQVSEIVRVVKAGVTSPQILAGVFFEALFFACLLILMAKSDISFLWPLTGLSFVFAWNVITFFFFGYLMTERSYDNTSVLLTMGPVVLIMAGAALISYSEHNKEAAQPGVPGQSSTPSHVAQ